MVLLSYTFHAFSYKLLRISVLKPLSSQEWEILAFHAISAALQLGIFCYYRTEKEKRKWALKLKVVKPLVIWTFPPEHEQMTCMLGLYSTAWIIINLKKIKIV